MHRLEGWWKAAFRIRLDCRHIREEKIRYTPDFALCWCPQCQMLRDVTAVHRRSVGDSDWEQVV